MANSKIGDASNSKIGVETNSKISVNNSKMGDVSGAPKKNQTSDLKSSAGYDIYNSNQGQV